MKTYIKPELEAIFLEEIDVIATSAFSEESEKPDVLITNGYETGVTAMSYFE